MIDSIEKLEAWGQRWDDAILWCESNLQPDTWRYLGDRIEIDNDCDYTLFILSNDL